MHGLVIYPVREKTGWLKDEAFTSELEEISGNNTDVVFSFDICKHVIGGFDRLLTRSVRKRPSKSMRLAILIENTQR